MKYKTLMAKALYDNTPESPEELLFRRGDILTVLEQNTGGLEGWWLCSLHGRQGIAPGNRLKLLIGPMFDGPPPAAQTPPPRGGGVASPGQGGLYQVPPGQEVYQVPPQRNALAADHTPSKVVTPTRVGRSYTYGAGQHNQQDLYDVPPTRSQGVYDVPPGKLTGSPYSGLHGPGARPQGVYDIPPSGPMDPRAQGVYDIPPSSQGVYSVPPCRSSAASVQEGNYDFPQPIRHKQEGVYDVPPPAPAQSPPQSSYDFPPTGAAAHASEGVYDVPPSSGGAGPQRDLYDFPRGKQTPQDRDRGGGKGGVYDAYDVLPPPQVDARALGDVTDGVNRLSFSSTGSSMSTSSSSASSEGRVAPDPDAAVLTLSRLQQAVEASSGALQALAASPHWRTPPFMERHAQEVRGALERVRAALGDLVAFGRAAAANATALSDPGLHGKLRRQLGRLEDSHGILLQTYQALESAGWAPRALAPPPTHPHHHHHVKTDDLDRFVMVARTVPDDAKQLASAIGGSAELLFRRALAGGGAVDGCGSRGGGGGTLEDGGVGVHTLVSPASDQTKPFPVGPGLDKDNRNNSEKCVKSWMEDYDYVHLQGKEDFERQQKELLEKENIMKQSKVQLGQEQINQFKQLEQEVIQPVENDMTQWMSHQQQQQHAASSSSSPPSDSSSPSPPSLGGGAGLCARDRQLLCFYSAQCQQHFVTLLNAVDAFFSCVGAGQPPRIFVAHGKLVILSAHKLVFIGDTLSRQAAAPEVADRVMSASNVLCALLKTVVGATKTAALRYPSTGAVQDMVDRVTDLSHRAQQFSQQLLHMAAL